MFLPVSRSPIFSVGSVFARSALLLIWIGAGQGVWGFQEPRSSATDRPLKPTANGVGEGGAAKAEKGRGDDEQSYSKQLPRIAPKSPVDSMSSMVIQPGYRIQLVAAEPNVKDPVAIAFDERSRMYVVEMCDYSEQEKEMLGTIRLLEDKDKDGTFESSVLFASGLSWPTAIHCFDGGVFVGAAPEILYLKDTDGDGVSDLKRTVFQGFGRGNVQGLMNSFCWGMDQRIYGQTSSAGGVITSPENKDRPPVDLSGRDFSFDPFTLELRPESGGGQHGMCFDDWGNRFSCQNSDHLQLHVYDARYQSPSNPITLPNARQSIASDGPQANVFRISEVEPWRVLRTHLRVSRKVAGLIEGGGQASGYFTSATGITVYRGDAMPELHGQVFIGDVGSNIVHRKRVERNGVSMVGNRIDTDKEFLAAHDTWFRPVQFANAPDGSLFVLDFYREVIEHPKSLPEEIKKHLDLTSGRDRGRIYRITKEGVTLRTDNDLHSLGLDTWVPLLVHPNAWHRDTASRRLMELLRSTEESSSVAKRETLKRIEALAASTESDAGKLHCLGVLVASNYTPEDVDVWLQHPNPEVRRQSIRLIETLMKKHKRFIPELIACAEDAVPSVRFQAAMSLSWLKLEIGEEGGAIAAHKLLNSMQEDAWEIAATGNAIYPFIDTVLVHKLDEWSNAGFTLDLEPMRVWHLLGTLAGKRGGEILHRLDRYVGLYNAEEEPIPIARSAIEARGERVDYDWQRMHMLGNFHRQIESGVKAAIESMGDDSMSPEQKLDCIRWLRWEKSEPVAEQLVRWLKPQESPSVQMAAIAEIAKYREVYVANRLIDSLTGLSPSIKSRCIDLLFSRKPWRDRVLERVGEGTFAWQDIESTKWKSLEQNGDAKTREQIGKWLGQSSMGTRREVLDRYRESIEIKGDVEAGKSHFSKACAACHRLNGVGYELGPSLASFKYRGAEAILENVIDPNREVNPQYISYSILTQDERTVTGMIQSEDATSVTLVRGENVKETVLRSEMQEMKSSRVSLMPEGLEQTLDVQAMADLIAYLLSTP